jgi:hypothetical protein
MQIITTIFNQRNKLIHLSRSLPRNLFQICELSPQRKTLRVPCTIQTDRAIQQGIGSRCQQSRSRGAETRVLLLAVPARRLQITFPSMRMTVPLHK